MERKRVFVHMEVMCDIYTTVINCAHVLMKYSLTLSKVSDTCISSVKKNTRIYFLR